MAITGVPKALYPSDPSHYAVAVTPSDADDLTYITRSLYIGVAGNVAVHMATGDAVTFANVPVGVLPVCVKRVLATGTTATGIVALY